MHWTQIIMMQCSTVEKQRRLVLSPQNTNGQQPSIALGTQLIEISDRKQLHQILHLRWNNSFEKWATVSKKTVQLKTQWYLFFNYCPCFLWNIYKYMRFCSEIFTEFLFFQTTANIFFSFPYVQSKWYQISNTNRGVFIFWHNNLIELFFRAIWGLFPPNMDKFVAWKNEQASKVTPLAGSRRPLHYEVAFRTEGGG